MSAGKLCVKTPNAADDEYITYINVFDFKEQKTIADIDYSGSPVKLNENKCLPVPDIQYQGNGKYAYTASTVLQKKQAKKLILTGDRLELHFSLKMSTVINRLLMF